MGLPGTSSPITLIGRNGRSIASRISRRAATAIDSFHRIFSELLIVDDPSYSTELRLEAILYKITPARRSQRIGQRQVSVYR